MMLKLFKICDKHTIKITSMNKKYVTAGNEKNAQAKCAHYNDKAHQY